MSAGENKSGTYEDRCQFCFALPGHEHHPLCPAVRPDVAEDWQALPPGFLLDHEKYQVGFHFNPGGCGITYLGWDSDFDRIVAIKECFPENHVVRENGSWNVVPLEGREKIFAEMLARFQQEKNIQSRFHKNRNIAQAFTSFRENNTEYFVMEYAEGLSVAEMVQKHGVFSWNGARNRIALPLLNALGDIHREGFLHLDIAPDNLYLSDDRELKLLDFGAAQPLSAANGPQKVKLLKNGYAPIEQYRRQDDAYTIGTYTDLYAAAATLYYALTGATPPAANLRAKEDTLIPPRELNPDIPEKCQEVLLKALAIRPEDRYQTVAEFREALLSVDEKSTHPRTFIETVEDVQPVAGVGFGKTEPARVTVPDADISEVREGQSVSGKSKSDAKSGDGKRKRTLIGVVLFAVIIAAAALLIFVIDPAPRVPATPEITAVETDDQDGEIDSGKYYLNREDVLLDQYGTQICYLLSGTMISRKDDCTVLAGKTCVLVEESTNGNNGKWGYLDESFIQSLTPIPLPTETPTDAE